MSDGVKSLPRAFKAIASFAAIGFCATSDLRAGASGQDCIVGLEVILGEVSDSIPAQSLPGTEEPNGIGLP